MTASWASKLVLKPKEKALRQALVLLKFATTLRLKLSLTARPCTCKEFTKICMVCSSALKALTVRMLVTASVVVCDAVA